MSRIALKFTNKDGRFCLCAHVKGTRVRHYRTVEGLKNPNFNVWDKKAQIFASTGKDDQANNRVLKLFLTEMQELLEQDTFENGGQLFAAYDDMLTARQEALMLELNKEKTLGAFLEELIEQLKNPTNRKPSANFQPYTTLLHKLQKEGLIIKTPLSKLNRRTLSQFSAWLLKQNVNRGTGKNYVGQMKVLIATINKARKQNLTEYIPNFPYMDHAPVINKMADNAESILLEAGTVNSLSPEQYEAFVQLDLGKVYMNHCNGAYYKELYRDFCILLYEMKSRPIDIIKLHWDNIAYNNVYGRWACAYIPVKKKNYALIREHDASPMVVQFLSDKALEIIMKHKDKSKGGYVLPFSVNNRKWNLDKAEDYHTFYNQQNRLQGRINHFLHKVGNILGVPFKLTTYAFRRTAITAALTKNEMPINMIAKVAGTSVSMIEHHYTNYLHALAEYQ